MTDKGIKIKESEVEEYRSKGYTVYQLIVKGEITYYAFKYEDRWKEEPW